MTDKISVNPTPIQRNAFDVAMELTTMYWNNSSDAKVEKLDSIFARFYATARLLEVSNRDVLKTYLPSDMKF